MTQENQTERKLENENQIESVVAPLTYTLKKSEKLVYKITEFGEDEDSPEYHDWYSVHDVTIRNGRSGRPSLSLDQEGFVLRSAKTSVKDFYDHDDVTKIYNPEVEKLVLDETGADKVLVFDHTIRVASDELRRQRKAREIVNLVHNDYTMDSGPQRVRDLLEKNDASQHLKARFAIYNLWRTIAGPVQSMPLALCDARSVNFADWVPCDLDYEDRMGEIYNTAYNPDHRWFYFPDMTPDETLIFKNYDSAEDGRARFTPHTAFVDPTTPADSPVRESIETRVLAFFTSENQ